MNNFILKGRWIKCSERMSPPFEINTDLLKFIILEKEIPAPHKNNSSPARVRWSIPFVPD